jgi:hypothetical protein
VIEFVDKLDSRMGMRFEWIDVGTRCYREVRTRFSFSKDDALALQPTQGIGRNVARDS